MLLCCIYSTIPDMNENLNITQLFCLLCTYFLRPPLASCICIFCSRKCLRLLFFCFSGNSFFTCVFFCVERPTLHWLILPQPIIIWGKSIKEIDWLYSEEKMSQNEPLFKTINNLFQPNSLDSFTNLFHELFLVWAENENSYGYKTGFFSQFPSWKRHYNKYSLKNILDSEFELGETIWWTHQKFSCNVSYFIMIVEI